MEWHRKDNAGQQGSGDFWYDLTDGGYIKPEEVIFRQIEINRLKEAIKIVKSFQHFLEVNDLLNDM